MSFVKAYAETFKGETFILGIEEPEAHLHPIAQRWLAKNINKISQGNVQIVITTHSPEFLDIENLEGFVKVYKENGITKTIQHSADTLAKSCIDLGANPSRTTVDSILPFYKTNTFTDQLKGFFARKIILVEGPSEFFALPNYFENCGYDLVKNGVEIIDCRGKSQIAKNYRLFKSFGYQIFCLFDADNSDAEKHRGNKELSETFNFDPNDMDTSPATFISSSEGCYGYFGKDFESYLRLKLDGYREKESLMEGTKPLKAKALSEQNPTFKPSLIDDIAACLKITKDTDVVNHTINLAEEDISF